MDSKACIQKLIHLSIQKLHIMKEKHQLIDDEKYFTESALEGKLRDDEILNVIQEGLLRVAKSGIRTVQSGQYFQTYEFQVY